MMHARGLGDDGPALMGDKAAMACTVAIEETIDEHYASQAAALGDDEAEPVSTVYKFHTFKPAEELAKRMSNDRRLELIHEANPD